MAQSNCACYIAVYCLIESHVLEGVGGGGGGGGGIGGIVSIQVPLL